MVLLNAVYIHPAPCNCQSLQAYLLTSIRTLWHCAQWASPLQGMEEDQVAAETTAFWQEAYKLENAAIDQVNP